jgi:hypothetical protein
VIGCCFIFWLEAIYTFETRIGGSFCLQVVWWVQLGWTPNPLPDPTHHPRDTRTHWLWELWWISSGSGRTTARRYFWLGSRVLKAFISVLLVKIKTKELMYR